MALGARRRMLRHPWAPRVIKKPGPLPGLLLVYNWRTVNAVLGILREGGFSIAQTHHALHILGSHLLGFTRELFADSAGADPEAAPIFPAGFAVAFPYAAEMALAVTHGGALGRCDDDAEFEFALDFILDGLGLACADTSRQAGVSQAASTLPLPRARLLGSAMTMACIAGRHAAAAR